MRFCFNILASFFFFTILLLSSTCSGARSTIFVLAKASMEMLFELDEQL